jgi:hypothetical protein
MKGQPAMATNLNQEQKNFFDKYEWWFVGLGLVGNSMFFVGSICFLFKQLETIAIGFFIFGSGLMLVSSSAESISEYSSNQLNQEEGQQSKRSHGNFKRTEYSS